MLTYSISNHSILKHFHYPYEVFKILVNLIFHSFHKMLQIYQGNFLQDVYSIKIYINYSFYFSQIVQVCYYLHYHSCYLVYKKYLHLILFYKVLVSKDYNQMYHSKNYNVTLQVILYNFFLFTNLLNSIKSLLRIYNHIQ